MSTPAPLRITRVTGFGRGRSETLNEPSIILGTDATNAIRFDPTWDRTVSPRHARLIWENYTWWIEDTSQHGTFLAGRKLTGRHRLNPGDVLELGKTGPTIRIEWTPVAAPEPAPKTQTPVAPPPVTRTPARPPTPSRRRWLIAGLAAAVVLVTGILLMTRRSDSSDSAFASIADEQSKAVALVVAAGNNQAIPFATAWAIGDYVYATNSHVTAEVEKILASGNACFLVVNRNPDIKLRITRARTHPRYGQNEINPEGQSHAVSGYDVGLLYTEERAPAKFRIAPRSELEKLDSGTRIAYLGFPMENMAGGGVNMRNPVATMQSGIVTAVTDYWLGKAAYSKRLLIQHNMGAAGGASGSPIFNAKGEVVGILSAGNVVGSITFSRDGSPKVTRAPSGVMVNFAQRIDLLADIWPDYPR